MENEENLYEVPPGLQAAKSEASMTANNQEQSKSSLPPETSSGSFAPGQSQVNSSKNNSQNNSTATATSETGTTVAAGGGGGSSSSSSTVVSPEKRANGYTEYLTPSLPHALDTLSQSTQASSTGTSICGLSDKNGGKNYRRSSRVSALSHRSSAPKKVPRSRKKSQRTFEPQSSPMDTILSQVESKSDSFSGSTGRMVDQTIIGSKNMIYDSVAKTSIASGQSHTLEQLSAQIEAHETHNSSIVPLIPNRKRSSVISTHSNGKNGSKGQQNVNSRICTRQHYPSGLYGWRKRILYFIILIASSLTVINLALIAYLYSALDLSLLDGSFGGSVLITSNGILVSGTSVFVNSTLAAKNIRSQSPLEALNIESASENILISSLKSNSITDLPGDQNVTSVHKLLISPESVNIMSDRLYIRKANGQLVFSADANKFTVASDHLRILHDYAFNLKRSLETPLIQSDFFDVLQISSITRGVKISAGNQVNITSKAGDVSIYSLKDLTLKSATGKIIIDASDIQLNNLKRVSPPPFVQSEVTSTTTTTAPSTTTTSTTSKSSSDHRLHTSSTATTTTTGQKFDSDKVDDEIETIYQLCSCADGRLFLVHSMSTCQRDLHLCS